MNGLNSAGKQAFFRISHCSPLRCWGFYNYLKTEWFKWARWFWLRVSGVARAASSEAWPGLEEPFPSSFPVLSAAGLRSSPCEPLLTTGQLVSPEQQIQERSRKAEPTHSQKWQLIHRFCHILLLVMWPTLIQKGRGCTWACDYGGGPLGPSWRLLTTGYSCRPRPVFKGPRAKMVFYILKGCKRENEEYVTETIHGLQSPNYLLYGSL